MPPGPDEDHPPVEPDLPTDDDPGPDVDHPTREPDPEPTPEPTPVDTLPVTGPTTVLAWIAGGLLTLGGILVALTRWTRA